MKVYVVRHGESETNLMKKWTGWFDAPLTEKGRDDARRAGEFLKNISFDKIYSSDLIRAIETKEIAIPHCCFEKTPDLREVNVGTLEGTTYKDMEDEERKNTIEKGYKKYGGETREEFNIRVKNFLKKLEEEQCENIALFCHAGVLRSMFDAVMGINVPRNHYCCNNCTVAVFEYENDLWKLHTWINLT